MLTEKEETTIIEFVREKLKNVDIAHKFDHIECVANNAKKIGLVEDADMKIVVPAAYLHDIVTRTEKYEDHTGRSAETAGKFLKKINFSGGEIQKIKNAIIVSSFESHEIGKYPKTLEEKVVTDADRLEAMGARGIARVFTFHGHYNWEGELGRVEWNPKRPIKLKMMLNKADPSPIYHFFSKLLWLKDLMYTKTGKKLAEERHKFMVEFLKRYKEEMK